MNERLSDFYYKNEFNLNYAFNTDKGILHDYIDGYYDSEFSFRKYHKLNLLEIGIDSGGSIFLWKNFLNNSEIYGVDTEEKITHTLQSLKDDSRVHLYFEDAYSDSFINKFPDDYFDYIIDDGPHTWESQIISINKWLSKLKPNGKLIIEDIQSESNLNLLIDTANKQTMCKRYTIIDLRLNKEKRYDDIIFEVIKKQI